MKNFLLACTLMLCAPALNADIVFLDLYAMLGVDELCQPCDIPQALTVCLTQASCETHRKILKNIAALLGTSVGNERYYNYVHQVQRLEKNVVVFNPFDEVYFLTEKGLADVEAALSSLIDKLNVDTHFTPITDVAFARPGSTPPIPIPGSPIMGRKSRTSQGSNNLWEDFTSTIG